ncbi:MAG: hypothetical protein KME15_02955 [Drouetiella hepatica Uher 2000/2452]|jgi:hypothetical protein|uniref:Uncharacterized protein n=1 Tax=Drouetiella hepatica Uher 2000/2452 TaxID=904376 RepID=A0A951UM95_9CYAN|nr:hypothetical protein [Drouetiella hepatica Uher 2000/2452]
MQHIDWISWILKIVQVWHSRSPKEFSEELSTRSYMLRRHLLPVTLVVLALGCCSVAQAEAGGTDEILVTASNPVSLEVGKGDRLEIPSSAAEIPVGAADRSWENLPPPDQAALTQAAPTQAAAQPIVSETKQASLQAAPVAANLLQTIKAETAAKPVELAFALSPQPSFQPQTASSQAILEPVSPAIPEADPGVGTSSLANLFVGHSDSLVAKAVGSAEGTRTPEGDRTPAYFGHVDPGNKAWNLGSFSYQHEATTPEDADAKQLNRLQDQASIMQAKAQAKGISLTLEEALNGIDLANQAPKAVLDREGYIDWLAKAHQNGLSGDDAVLWARTQSFFDPNLQRWNAPGLGNTQERITHDQERRMKAIDRAIAVHEQPLIQPAQSLPQPEPFQPALPQPALPQPTAQPVAQESHKLSEDIGIARLFAEKTISYFGGTVPSSVSKLSQPEQIHSSSVTESDSGLATLAPQSADSSESPGIAALFDLDLPSS